MTVKRSAFLTIFMVSLASFVFGQAVTFHSPVPWITLRENKIIAKTKQLIILTSMTLLPWIVIL